MCYNKQLTNAIHLIEKYTNKKVVLKENFEEKDGVIHIEINCEIPEQLQEVNETNRVELSKVNWNELQNNIITACFSEDIFEILPVKLSSSKNYAAQFRADYFIKTKVLENAHFKFNKLKEWNHQSLNNVMAHEIIHYYMCLIGNPRESHGTNFKKEMNRINSLDLGIEVSLTDDQFVLGEEASNKLGGFIYILELPNSGNNVIYVPFKSEKSYEEYKNYIINRKQPLTIKKYSIDYKTSAENGITLGRKPNIYIGMSNFKNNVVPKLKYLETVYDENQEFEEEI